MSRKDAKIAEENLANFASLRDILSRLGLESLDPEGAGREMASINPATGLEIGRIRMASRHDYERMAAEATAAFARWRLLPAPRRGQIVREIADELRAAKSALGALVSL